MRIKIGNKVYNNDITSSKHYTDLLSIQTMMEQLGFPRISLNDIELMWDAISSKYCAVWLEVPKTKDELLKRLEVIEVCDRRGL